MGAQNEESAALLAHIVSQVESNVQFLAAQNYISQADASAFLAKLPSSNVSSRLPNMHTGMAPPMFTPRTVPAAIPTQSNRARALWAYNENGQDPDDLSFTAGDIIEIVEETNADWWMGRVNGKQALFPSAYVEKINSTPIPVVTQSKKPYKPFGAAMHGTDIPPPAGAGTNSAGLQQAPGQAEKKNKYGKYGDTMAHSAASGVGFGAGAAIGGGLVRAIF